MIQVMQAEISDRLRDMDKNAEDMAARSQKDSTMMKILTLVTIFFLPPTFVSVRLKSEQQVYRGHKADLCRLSSACVGPSNPQ